MVQPLLAEHGQEGREEGNDKAFEENGLDVNCGGGRSSSLWENGNLVSEHGVVNLVEEDVEQSSGIIT